MLQSMGLQSWTWLSNWTTTINQHLGFLGILHQHTMLCYVLRLFPKQSSHDLNREGRPQITPELPWGGWALQATLNWKKTFRLTKFLLTVNGLPLGHGTVERTWGVIPRSLFILWGRKLRSQAHTCEDNQGPSLAWLPLKSLPEFLD